MGFRRAERKKAKLRLGIVGPAGSGKTYSSLLVAKGLGGKVAVIDTENGSGDLYAHLMEYDVCTLDAPYTVDKYVKAIEEAERGGYDTIIIDSLSHAWAGEGGLLDQQGKIADAGRGNSYTAWRQITPMHNRFVEAMLTSKCHVIATMRSKTEYVLETNDRGKQEPKKVGMAPVQREGMDYEFTTVLELATNHNATVSKDRTSLFDGQIFKPSEKTGEALLAWLETGVDIPAPQVTPQATPQVASLRDDPAFALDWIKVSELTEALGWKKAEVQPWAKEHMGMSFKDMKQADIDQLTLLMQEELDNRNKQEVA